MSLLNFKPAEEAAKEQKPALPSAILGKNLSPELLEQLNTNGVAVEMVEGQEKPENIYVLIAFPTNYPEEAIGVRLGRAKKDENDQVIKDENGQPVKDVTSRTYGHAKEIALGFADGENNFVVLNAKMFAPVAGATGTGTEGETGETEDETETEA